MEENQDEKVSLIRNAASECLEEFCGKNDVECSIFLSDYVDLYGLQDMIWKIEERIRKNVFYNRVVLVGSSGLERGTEDIAVDYGKWSLLLEDGKYDELLQSITFVIHKLTLHHVLDDVKLRELHGAYLQVFYGYVGRNAADFRMFMMNEENSRMQRQAAESVGTFLDFVKMSLVSLEQYQKESQDQNHIVTKIKQYIGEHLSEKISRDEISAYVNFNESYISRLFHREVGMSISDYITQERITLAKSLLLQTNKSIGQIAEETGFGTAAYFIKVFRKYTDVTPKEFRKREKF